MTGDLSNFLIAVESYVVTDDGRKLDRNLILRFKAFTEDAQRELYRQWIASIDAMHFIRAVENGEHILFKVETFKIDTKNKTITFRLPCRESVRLYLDGDLINGITAHDLMLSYIRGVPKLVRNLRYAYYVLEDVEIRTYRPRTDIAKELLNDYNPVDLIACALGYRPTPEVKALILPRILPLFTTNEDSSGTHILSLTSPGLGKSECARILSELAQAFFSPFFPAPTKLIGDARTNTYGLAYHYNTIFVDEFLHGESSRNLKENYNAILTGMENAKWSRERGQIDFERTVSFAFFGNVQNDKLDGISAYSENHREIVEGVLRSTLGIETIEPFMERLAYVEYLVVKDYRIMKDLNRNDQGRVLYLDPTIARGIIKLLAERVLKSGRLKKSPKDRFERHINRLYAILKALGIDLDEGTIEDLVYGRVTFWDIRNELFGRREKISVRNDKNGNTKDVPTDEFEEIESFDVSEAMGYGKVDSVDLLDDNDNECEQPSNNFLDQDNTVTVPVDGGYVEYKLEIPYDAQEDVKNEIAYVTVEITRDLGERNEIVGTDGKTYKLEKGKRITLPYKNARILVKHDVAKAIHPPDFVLEAEQKDKYVQVWFVDGPHVGSFCNGKRLCKIKGEWVKEDVCRLCRSVLESERSECVSKTIV